MTSLYLFDSNQELIKIIPQKDLIQARQKEELQENDLPIDRFTAEYKLDAFKDVEAIHYFAVKDLNKPNQFHMYFLKQPIINENTVLLEGVQLAYKELKHFIIQEIHPQDRQAEFMMNQVLQGTGWSVRYVAETVQASQHFYFMPALEALKVVSGLFGIELVFKVEISGQKITDKWVEAYNRRGSRTMKRFTHGSNLLSVKGTIERDNIYTALIGRGRGEETEGGGFGRRITFEEIEWSVANADPVDKPLGQNYVEIPSATKEYGINMPDGSKVPAMGVVEFQDIEEPDELLKAVYDELAYRIRPLVQYETTVADVGDVELGEVVGVHRYDLGLHYETRIFKLTRDYLNPKRTPVELGDKVIESRRDREIRTQNTIGNINREQALIREEVSYVQNTADGKNKIFRQETAPDTGMAVNDLWYKPVGEGETELYRWNGSIWQLEKVSAGLLGGTLDAENGDVNLINVNVANIVGETSEFVRSGWNAVSGGMVTIDGSGVRSLAGDGSTAALQNGVFLSREPSGATLGYIGFDQTGSSPFFTQTLALGSNFRIRANRGGSTFDHLLEIFPGSNEAYIRTESTRITGALYAGDGITVQNGGNVTLNGGGIVTGAYGYYLTNGGSILSLSTDSTMRVSSNQRLSLITDGTSTALSFDSTHGYMYRTLSMEGNNITNQSDIRLKTNVTDATVDALKEIDRMRFIDFEWDKSMTINERKPDGRHFSIEAQYSPFLQTHTAEEESYLSIDMNKQIMLNSKAIQELYTMVKERFDE